MAEELLPSQRRDRAGLAPASLVRASFGVAGTYHPRTTGETRPATYDGFVAALVRIAHWAPVVLWAALIFVLSSIPDLATGLGSWDYVARKLGHAAEFAVLGGLLMRALGREPLALGLGSLYAVTDEVHQAFVAGRVASPVDWTIDTVGVALGVALVARAR